MKKTTFLLLCFLGMVSLIAFPTPVLAQSPTGDGNGNGKVIFGGTYILKSGEILSGDLAVFGGKATIEQNATVDGDIFIMGGSLEVSGTVKGDLVAVGGNINLSSSSMIEKNLTTIYATVQRADGSTINGDYITETPESADGTFLPFLKNAFKSAPAEEARSNSLDFIKPFYNLLWMIFKSLSLAALALIAMLFLEKPTRNVTRVMIGQPLIAGGFGLLTLIVAPPLLILIGITILLLPVSLVGFLLLASGLLFGWIAAGFEVGMRISDAFKWHSSPPVCAGIGTLVTTIVASMVGWIPCIGWLATALILMLGLGSVILSRFGTKEASPSSKITVDGNPVSRTDPPASPSSDYKEESI